MGNKVFIAKVRSFIEHVLYVYVWQHSSLHTQARLEAEMLHLNTVMRLHMQGYYRKFGPLLIFKGFKSFGGQN